MTSNPIVIKFGGSLLDNQTTRKVFLQTLAAEWAAQQQKPAEQQKRARIILVHGGGKEITRELEKRKILAQFDKGGRRITDEPTMAVVEEVLGRINASIAQEFEQWWESKAQRLSGKSSSLVLAKQLPDLGLVGIPDQVNKKMLDQLLKNSAMPIFYSVAVGYKGETLNINADDFAQALAIACQASRLIFLTDTGGVFDKSKKIIPRINVGNVEGLISDGIITGGMIVKIKACCQALSEGVDEVIIGESVLSDAQGLHVERGTTIAKTGPTIYDL